MAEEDNSKLKTRLAESCTERLELQTALMKSNINKDDIEEKLQHVAKSIDMKVSQEVTSLKATMLREVNDMKSELKKEIAMQRSRSPVSSGRICSASVASPIERQGASSTHVNLMTNSSAGSHGTVHTHSTTTIGSLISFKFTRIYKYQQ